MIGLLKKDMYMVGWLGLLLLPLTLVISLVPRMEYMGMIYPATLAFMMPLWAVTYDEESRWDRYAAMLPYRTEQIVGSKYILSSTYIVLGVITAFLSGLFQNLIRPDSVDWIKTFKSSAMILLIMAVTVSIGLPALYCFGARTGRTLLMMIMAAGMGVILGVGETLLMNSELLPPPAIAIGVIVLAVIVIVVSARVSLHFYKKRWRS